MSFSGSDWDEGNQVDQAIIGPGFAGKPLNDGWVNANKGPWYRRSSF